MKENRGKGIKVIGYRGKKGGKGKEEKGIKIGDL